MGLPQVPLGSHIRPNWQTDRNIQTHTGRHTQIQSIPCPSAHSSYSTPAHMLPRHATLCIKQWLCSTSIFFSDTKLFFTPLASPYYMEVLKWIMETTELKTHGIHLKMWERRCSQGLDCRNIMLQVNESTIVLHCIDMLVGTVSTLTC